MCAVELEPLAVVVSDSEVVEAFEKMLAAMLESVKTEGIRAFGIVVVEGDGCISSSFCSGNEHHRLVGGLGGLEFDIRLSAREIENDE